jgi:membrane dipeptidase
MTADPADPADIADGIHGSSIVVDAACPGAHWQEQYQRWRAGGVGCCVVLVAGYDDLRRALSLIGGAYRFVRERDELRIATTTDDVRCAKDEGALAVVLHFQGLHAIEYELDLLELYWRLGVRVMQLTYNQRNPVGDGCEEPSDAGLSNFGRRVVKEMNRLGLAIDISHAGERTARQAIEVSTAPVIASHANARALQDSVRNLRDETIRAVADTGGVIGITGFPGFVSGSARPTLDDYIGHIDHVAGLVGIEHVALGLDFIDGNGSIEEFETSIREGIWSAGTYPPPPWHYPSDLDDATRFPNLTRGLIARGYSEGDVRAVLGENWLRVFDQIWSVNPEPAPRAARGTL